MTLTIELPDDLEVTLKAHADAQGVSTDGYARRILQQALTQKPATNDLKPKKSGYGILAKYGPGPSEEDIDQNRRETFRGFAEDARRFWVSPIPMQPFGIFSAILDSQLRRENSSTQPPQQDR